MCMAKTVFLSKTQLEQVLERILKQDGALPEDWEAESTTYDLPRFHSEAEFRNRFQRAVEQILENDIHDPRCLKALLATCGHPYDYARLGHPLSTVYELYLEVLTEAERAVTFASWTKAFLAPIEARRTSGPVRLYAAGSLGLSKPGRDALRTQQAEIHENWTGPLPELLRGTLTLYVSDGPPPRDAAGLKDIQADAASYRVEEGGVLLIRRAAELGLERIQLDLERVQLVRKRTVAALLAANAKAELRRLLGLTPQAPPADSEEVSEAKCDEELRKIFPKMRDSAYFCTGLAAEAAVFSATAEVLADEFIAQSAADSPGTPIPRPPVRLLYAENAYGGSVQLIDEILSRDGQIARVPLPVLSRTPRDQKATLVDRVIEFLPALQKRPAFLFLENPTNPDLQEHDFGRLVKELKAHQANTGLQIPVLVDTTLAPLYPLFDQEFARSWPFLIVKSGSKYLTKGKATLGLALCADNALAQKILDKAKDHRDAADNGAKSSQLRALKQGLEGLSPRMEKIANNAGKLARQIKEQLERRRPGHEVRLYSMSDDQLKVGLYSGILSFYLPPASTTHLNLVDEFVEDLLTRAPELVKNRVSYGQSSGYFYVINPEESTQGALSKDVKDSQKIDGVQICRISVPENADVEGLVRVMSDFFDKKYGSAARSSDNQG